MEIKKTISVKLTPDEVCDILKKHFSKNGIEIDHIYFNVDAVYDEGDWRGEYPPHHKMTEVRCEGVEKEREEYKPSHS